MCGTRVSAVRRSRQGQGSYIARAALCRVWKGQVCCRGRILDERRGQDTAVGRRGRGQDKDKDRWDEVEEEETRLDRYSAHLFFRSARLIVSLASILVDLLIYIRMEHIYNVGIIQHQLRTRLVMV